LQIELENMSVYEILPALDHKICPLECTVGQILDFQNTFDRVYEEIRLYL
jgi:hypothetical protein